MATRERHSGIFQLVSNYSEYSGPDTIQQTCAMRCDSMSSTEYATDSKTIACGWGGFEWNLGGGKYEKNSIKID